MFVPSPRVAVLVVALALAVAVIAVGLVVSARHHEVEAARTSASVLASAIGARVSTAETPSIDDLRLEIEEVLVREPTILSVAVMCATGPMSGSIVAEARRDGTARTLATPVDLTTAPHVRSGFTGTGGGIEFPGGVAWVAPAGPACSSVVEASWSRRRWLVPFGVLVVAAAAALGTAGALAASRPAPGPPGIPASLDDLVPGALPIHGPLGSRFTHMARRVADRRQIQSAQVVPDEAFAGLVAAMGTDAQRTAVAVVRGVLDLGPGEGSLAPAELVAVVDTLLAEVAGAAGRWEGTLVRCPDTSWMIVFGAPVPLDAHADHALRCALELRERFVRLAREWDRTPSGERGRRTVRMAVATGQAVGGFAWPASHRAWSLFGEVVRVAERLDAVAAQLEVDLVVLAPTLQSFGGPIAAWATGRRVVTRAGEIEVHAVGLLVDTPALLKARTDGEARR